MQIQIQRACDVQVKYTDMLMRLPNVVGIGVGFAKRDHAFSANGATMGGASAASATISRQVALIVMVDRKIDAEDLAPAHRIPSMLDGIPVDVQEMGVFSAD